MQLIDVALVSGRRPELLSKTLESFSANLFGHFEIGRFIVNIDPFGGDEDDHEACVALIKQRFPQAIIFEPHAPSFGMAVKTVWSATSSPIVLHLEDDWLLNDSVLPGEVFPRLVDGVALLQFQSKEMKWDGGKFRQMKKKKRFAGIVFGSEVVNIFGTSPGFWIGDVARKAASLICPNLDPEKQMRPPHNDELFRYLNDFRCSVLHRDGGMLITDIGREWREKRNLIKVVADGKSSWVVGQ